MKVIKSTKTGYINDFQSNATEEGLIKNAVGWGHEEKNLVVEDVSKEEFNQIKEDYFIANPPEPDPRDALMESVRTKLIGLGITEDELNTWLR